MMEINKLQTVNMVHHKHPVSLLQISGKISVTKLFNVQSSYRFWIVGEYIHMSSTL